MQSDIFAQLRKMSAQHNRKRVAVKTCNCVNGHRCNVMFDTNIFSPQAITYVVYVNYG